MEDRNKLDQIMARHGHKKGPLMLILHDIQAEFGYVPPDFIAPIADRLHLSRADVHGVMSFYHEFRTKPAGRHILRLCRAEACQAMEGRALWEKAKERLGLDWHQTSDDSQVTLEEVFCLGLCANAPAAMLDERPIANVDEQKLDQILSQLQP